SSGINYFFLRLGRVSYVSRSSAGLGVPADPTSSGLGRRSNGSLDDFLALPMLYILHCVKWLIGALVHEYQCDSAMSSRITHLPAETLVLITKGFHAFELS